MLPQAPSSGSTTAGIATAASYMRRMKPHVRRGRKAREKRIERVAARKAGQKQAA